MWLGLKEATVLASHQPILRMDGSQLFTSSERYRLESILVPRFAIGAFFPSR